MDLQQGIGMGISGTQPKIFGPPKNLIQKNVRPKKFSPKKCWSHKSIGPREFVKKNCTKSLLKKMLKNVGKKRYR